MLWLAGCSLKAPVEVSKQGAPEITLVGVVYGVDNSWIQGAQITLERANGQILPTPPNKPVESDRYGRWRMTISPVIADYFLHVEKEGYIFHSLELPVTGAVIWNPNRPGWFRFPSGGTFDRFTVRMSILTELTKGPPSLTPSSTHTRTPTLTRTQPPSPTMSQTSTPTPSQTVSPSSIPSSVVTSTATKTLQVPSITPTPYISFDPDPLVGKAVLLDFWDKMPIKIDNPRLAPFAAIAAKEMLGPPTTFLEEFTLELPDGTKVHVSYIEVGCKYVLWMRSDQPNAVHLIDAYGYGLYSQYQLPDFIPTGTP